MKICIFRLSAIGDVCHAVSCVQAIQRHYPGAEITWVIGKVEAALFSELPGVRFFIVDKNKWRQSCWQLLTKLPCFDYLLLMQVSFRANMFSCFIKARRKIGFNFSRAKEGHSLCIHRAIKAQSEPHVIESFQAFAAAIGVPDYEPTWDIPIADECRQWALGYRGAKPLAIVSPSASHPKRNWLPDRYAAIIDYLDSRGLDVVICGGPSDSERELGCEIESQASVAVTNLVGQTSLQQLLALIAIAQLVLSPDSGPAHMAVTQGVPVIGLYGHNNPKRTGPYFYLPYVVEVYHHHLQLQYQKTAAELPWGIRTKGNHIMQDITVGRVQEAIDRAIEDFSIGGDNE